MVEYHPISAIDLSTIHQFGKKVSPGIFLGYELDAVRISKGDILIAILEDLEKFDTSTIHPRRIGIHCVEERRAGLGQALPAGSRIVGSRVSQYRRYCGQQLHSCRARHVRLGRRVTEFVYVVSTVKPVQMRLRLTYIRLRPRAACRDRQHERRREGAKLDQFCHLRDCVSALAPRHLRPVARVGRFQRARTRTGIQISACKITDGMRSLWAFCSRDVREFSGGGQK